MRWPFKALSVFPQIKQVTASFVTASEMGTAGIGFLGFDFVAGVEAAGEGVAGAWNQRRDRKAPGELTG